MNIYLVFYKNRLLERLLNLELYDSQNTTLYKNINDDDTILYYYFDEDGEEFRFDVGKKCDFIWVTDENKMDYAEFLI